MNLRLLGAFEAQSKNGAPVRLPTRKVRALLCYLALQPDRRFSRGELASLFWGDEEEALARQSLRQGLSALRRCCPALEVSREFVRLPAGAVSTDVRRLEAAVETASLQGLAAAASLHQGELLQELEIGSDRFRDWLAGERGRVAVLMTSLVSRLVEALARSGDLAAAAGWARRLVNEDPFDERRHRAYMSLLVQAGDTRAALKHFDDLNAFLKRELGVGADAQTRRLVETLGEAPRDGRAYAQRLQEMIGGLGGGPLVVTVNVPGDPPAQGAGVAESGEMTLERHVTGARIKIPLRSADGALQGYVILAPAPARGSNAPERFEETE